MKLVGRKTASTKGTAANGSIATVMVFARAVGQGAGLTSQTRSMMTGNDVLVSAGHTTGRAREVARLGAVPVRKLVSTKSASTKGTATDSSIATMMMLARTVGQSAGLAT